MRYLYLLLAIFSSAGTLAQTFPDDAEWHYRYFTAFQLPTEQSDGYDHLWVDGIEIIDGIECQRIARHRHYFSINTLGNPDSEWEGPFVEELSNQYVYSSGDTTFYYEEGQFFILWIFDAPIGSTWESEIINEEDINIPVSTLYTTHVTGTGTIDFLGESRRFIDLQGIPDGGCSPFGHEVGRVVEGVGFIQTPSLAYMFPDYTSINGCAGLSETESFGLNCFYASDIGAYSMVSDCTSFPVGLLESAFEGVKLFPNPVEDIVQLQGLNAQVSLELQDLSGRQVLSKELQAQELSLDLSDVPAGMYVLILTAADGESWNQQLFLR